MKMKSIFLGLSLLLFSLTGMSQDTSRNSSSVVRSDNKGVATAVDSSKVNTTGSVNGTMPNSNDAGSVTTNPSGKTAGNNATIKRRNNGSSATSQQNSASTKRTSSTNSNSSTSSSSSTSDPSTTNSGSTNPK